MSKNVIYNLNKRALKILERYNEEIEQADSIEEYKPLIHFIGKVFSYTVDILGVENPTVEYYNGLELQRARLCKEYKKLKAKFTQEERELIENGLKV